jgi:hypothetical protein
MDAKSVIESLGGPLKVAEKLGYSKRGGSQRVHNWIKRGIPSKVLLEHSHLFLSARLNGIKTSS